MKQTKWVWFVFFKLFKPQKIIFRVVVYPFFGLERLTTKKELIGVSFTLFLESLKMKIFLSEFALFHTHSSILKSVYPV